jgi:hypothetical protein
MGGDNEQKGREAAAWRRALTAPFRVVDGFAKACVKALGRVHRAVEDSAWRMAAPILRAEFILIDKLAVRFGLERPDPEVFGLKPWSRQVEAKPAKTAEGTDVAAAEAREEVSPERAIARSAESYEKFADHWRARVRNEPGDGRGRFHTLLAAAVLAGLVA